MPAVARAELEALLRTRKLDRTLTTTLPCPGSGDEQAIAPTGIAALDRLLNGGIPRGQLSEVVGARSSGRTSVSVAMLAAAIVRGELVALVDALDMFDPPSAAAAGVDLTRLLWVRGPTLIDRAIKAVNLVLQAGGFGLVVLDLAEVPVAAIRRLPFTTWLRLQRVLEGSKTACIVMGAEPTARSSGGITIALRSVPDSSPDARVRPPVSNPQSPAPSPRPPVPSLQPPGLWAGETERARLLLGLEIEARIIRARAAVATSCRFRVSSSPRASLTNARRTDHRPPATGHRRLATDHRPPATGH